MNNKLPPANETFFTTDYDVLYLPLDDSEDDYDTGDDGENDENIILVNEAENKENTPPELPGHYEEIFIEYEKNFRGLSREQLDNILMGQLLAFDNETDGIIPRVHGNTKRIPQRNTKVTINYELAKEVRTFVTNYASVNGLPSPGRHLSKVTSALIYLPTNENYTTVFEHFQQSMRLTFGDEQKIMSRNSFVRLWKALTPHITFLKPQSDLCTVCEELRYKIAHNNDPQRKEDVIKEYSDHLRVARLERDYYQCNITQAQQDTEQLSIKQLIQNPLLKSID
ncbi:2483_t:CDS:2, partial [Paraglomus brasilianum]